MELEFDLETQIADHLRLPLLSEKKSHLTMCRRERKRRGEIEGRQKVEEKCQQIHLQQEVYVSISDSLSLVFCVSLLSFSSDQSRMVIGVPGKLHKQLIFLRV